MVHEVDCLDMLPDLKKEENHQLLQSLQIYYKFKKENT